MRKLISVSAGFAVSAFLLTLPGAAKADEPIFGYVYTTDLLPKGKTEIEQWVTLREGRSNGDFHLIQTRTEVSHALTDRLQISGYLNFAHADVDHDGPDGSTVPPEVFADFASGPDRRFTKTRFESAAFEGIYRLSSPYTAPVGAAIYVEPSIGPRTREVETRLILQKNFRDDRLIFAFNATLAYEWRRLLGDPGADPGSIDARDHWDKETDVNFGVAGSYRFARKTSAGIEFQNEREFAGLNPLSNADATNVAWYLGPTLHYGGEHVFATLTTLFQLPIGRDLANTGADSVIVRGLNNGDDFEKYRVRLKIGYYF